MDLYRLPLKLFCVVALTAMAGCGDPTGTNQEPRPPQVPISELQIAPETLVIAGLPVSVEVYLDLVSGGGGPAWGPGIPVDVVVGVREGDGALSLAIIRNVVIRRTA